MRDTSDAFAALVDARYAAMTPLGHIQIVCGMRQTALAIIDSSLPRELIGAERRFAIMKRFYDDDPRRRTLGMWQTRGRFRTFRYR